MDTVANYAERFGVYNDMGRFLANSLGSEETTLYQMVPPMRCLRMVVSVFSRHWLTVCKTAMVKRFIATMNELATSARLPVLSRGSPADYLEP